MNDRPRYDGLADWYDAEVQHGPAADVTATALRSLIRHLGSGPGKCLDVGCGTGIALLGVEQTRLVRGRLDISADQLRIARERTRRSLIEVLEADASHLPFPSASFDAVVSMLTHSDFDDPAAAFGEACRVLRPGGKFVYVGTHPCFVTPYVERKSGAAFVLHPGYRRRGWTNAGPGFGQGIRPRPDPAHCRRTATR